MKAIFGISADTLESYEEAARKTADAGATHLAITENIPVARWQFDTPNDPYPSWYAFQPGFMKTFPPEAVRPYVDEEHAKRVGEILQKRSEILERYNLRGVYHTTEPQVLPEAAFQAHPDWRGPRVDQPNRSRVARFAPCVGNAEVQQLYAESIQLLLRCCPQVDTFVFLTIDSGSGFCWAPSLYPGANGCSRCHAGDLEDRAVGFIQLLADSAQAIDVTVEIDLVEIEPRSWMRKTFADPVRTAKRLRKGLAINHCEGPEGSRYANGRYENLFFNAFYPVVGLPRPVAFLRKLIASWESGGERAILGFNDGLNTDLNIAVYKAYQATPVAGALASLSLLHAVAEGRYGSRAADAVVDLWLALDDVEKQLASVDFGPFLLMGGLLARWITRPFVPFPEELSAEERAPFYPFLFQARNEASALNLIDIQAMRMYEGWGARLLVEQTINVARSHLQRAIQAVRRLELEAVAEAPTLHARVNLLAGLLQNGQNAVAYQAQLDRMKASMPMDLGSLAPPPLGATASWDRLDLVNLARAEIDNTVRLRELIRDHGRSILDLAPEGIPETIMRFGSNLCQHLDRKIETMSSRWGDYDRVSPPANP